MGRKPARTLRMVTRRLEMRFVLRSLLLAAAALAAGGERPAEACGGCFHEEIVPAPQRSVVTDHRMAFSISPTQTVLWDQIRYAGDPREFAWVLPVRPGARVELSRDAWFAALDASTQPVIQGPAYSGQGYGCALGGCGSSEAAGEGASSPGPGQVQLVSQSVIGPYETVTLRATDPNALENWLHQHGFAIPDAIQPTIDAYVSEGFDFIALRLRPDCGQKAMKPVRVVSPGADTSLPLRMVAAGVGANVGVTLYVISEGRYEPQNFPVEKIDYTRLVWDRTLSRSNYEELSQEAMGKNGGRSWIVEASDRASLATGASTPYNPGLLDAYVGLCLNPGVGTGGGVVQPCVGASGTPDAGVDAEAADAGTDAGDAQADAGTQADASAIEPPTACVDFDDLDVATTGMHTYDVWVTRLRAVLPAQALTAGDLHLTAAAQQAPESNYHYASSFSDDASAKQTRKSCAGAPMRHRPLSPIVLAIAAALAGAAVLRRRRR
jgi:hypothetical protein